MAKAPGFFKNYGFATVKREDAPNIFGCLIRDRYGKTANRNQWFSICKLQTWLQL